MRDAEQKLMFNTVVQLSLSLEDCIIEVGKSVLFP